MIKASLKNEVFIKLVIVYGNDFGNTDDILQVGFYVRNFHNNPLSNAFVDEIERIE